MKVSEVLEKYVATLNSGKAERQLYGIRCASC